jgi:phosphopantetheinyl transferase
LALDLAHALAPPFACRAWLMRGPSPAPERILPILAGSEREAARRAARRPARSRAWSDWWLSRAALRRAAGELLELPSEAVRLCKSPRGAPRLMPVGPGAQPAAVSLAHVRGLGAAAVASGVAALGLDVELAARLGEPRAFLRQIATGAELTLVAARPPRAAAVTLWTLKEAAAKASGEGLDGRPERVVVTFLDAGTGDARVSAGGRVYAARVRLGGEGAVALAWRGVTSPATA